MGSAAHLAMFGAAGLAMVAALFGVLIARMLWADDLKHAQKIDEIRSRTEVALRGSIEAKDKMIAILKSRLGE